MRTPMPVAVLALVLASIAGCASFQAGPHRPSAPMLELIRTGDHEVRVKTDGAGHDVVLIHGFASGLVVWEGVHEALCEDRRCTRLDLPGFGSSSKRAGDYSPKALAAVVVEVMDRRGIGAADIVAHSWGCAVALALALEHPERVRRLVLTSAWVYTEQIPTFFHWARVEGLGELLFTWLYDQQLDVRARMGFADPDRWLTQALMDEIEHAMDRPGAVRAALQAVRDMRLNEQQGRYPEVTKPSLLVWGAEDRVSRVSTAHRLARDLTGSSLETIAGCGHLPMVECAPRYVALVRGFLR